MNQNAAMVHGKRERGVACVITKLNLNIILWGMIVR